VPERTYGLRPLRVLDGDSPGDLRVWLRLWHDWSDREVFAHPGYVRLFADVRDRAVCAFWDRPGASALYPFVLRCVRSHAAAGTSVHDIVSPYGYCGPYRLSSGGVPDDSTFWSHFSAWCADLRVVCEFVRLPLLGTVVPHPGPQIVVQQHVVRDLHGDEAFLWRDVEHKVRKNVNKARRSGVSVVSDEGDRLDDFLSIYVDTMDRRGASDYYYFGRAFFEQLQETLRGQYRYFHALVGGEVVSSELVLISAHSVYSFLGGTRSHRFDVRPNDLLKYEIMVWAQTHGFQWYVLGGGAEPDDGIYRYKLSFAPGSVRPYYTVRRVLDEDLYESLVRERAAAEPGWLPKPGYFPAYRG